MTEGLTERPRGGERCVEWSGSVYIQNTGADNAGGRGASGFDVQSGRLEREERRLKRCKTYLMRRCFLSVRFSTAAALKLSAEGHRRAAEVSATGSSAQETITIIIIHVKPLLVLCF